MLGLSDQRLTKGGEIVIKAQRFCSLEKNRADALGRLGDLIREAVKQERKRRPTKPSRSSTEKRLEGKEKGARVKATSQYFLAVQQQDRTAVNQRPFSLSR